MTADALARLETVARARRSVRAFRPEPVPRETIERAVAVAQTSPSSCNTQPWRIEIVSGPVLAQLSATLMQAAESGAAPDYDLPAAEPYVGAFRKRQIDAAVRLFEATGVRREDRQARAASLLRNYVFFGAPHAAFIFMPRGSGLREASDCGHFIQTFLLSLTAAGIGSCPQGALVAYSGLVREHLGMNDDQRLLLGVSFGYADEDDPSARVRPPRDDLESVLGWHG